MKKNLLLTCCCVAVGAGCGGHRVNLVLDMPPQAVVMRGAAGVAVVPLRGNYGAQFATTELVRAIGPHAGGRVTDDDSGQAVSGWMASASPSGPAGTAAGVSGSVGADLKSERKQSAINKCFERDKNNKCTNMREVPYYETVQSCTITVQLTIRRAGKTGNLITPGDLGIASGTWGSEDNYPSSHEGELCTAALQTAVAAATRWVAPHKIAGEIKFMSVEGDQGGTKSAAESLATGKRREAGDAFEGIPSEPGLKPKDQAWALYNLALFRYVETKFEECLSVVGQAQAVLGQDSDVTKLLEKCKKYVN